MDQFNRNMEILAVSHPSLQRQLVNYSPVDITNYEGDEKDLVVHGNRFYGMDASLACKLQCDAFFRQPMHYSVSYINKNWSKQLHQVAINQLNDAAKHFNHAPKGVPSNSSFLVLGAGLGDYIKLFSQQFHIRHLVIVEPDMDMLYWFMFHVDLEVVLHQCDSFSILQTNTLQSFEQAMFDVLHNVGYDLLAELSVYRHYETELFDKILHQFTNIRHRWLSSWGFFDDELEGLINTKNNCSDNQFFLKTQLKSDTPAVIVGNGPSLDKDIDTLKKRSGEFLIVSCGSAIGALLTEGIIPDIHVEMERSQHTASIQKKWFTPDVTDNVVLLALNTVPLNTTERFRHCWLFPKANDVANLLLVEKNKNGLKPLHFCNPTATNFATAALIRMGLTNLYLLGCDYGYRDNQQHHAQKSDYYNETSQLSKVKVRSETIVPDNKGMPILSTRIFNLARHNIERLLSRHPYVTCTNCSNGAKIEGANWTPFSSVKTTGPTPYSISKEHLLNSEGFSITLKNKESHKRISHVISTIEGLLTTLQRLKKQQRLDKLLSALTEYLNTIRQDNVNHILMSGSLKYLSVCISGHVSRIPLDNQPQYMAFAFTQINAFLTESKSTLHQLLHGDLK